MTQTQDTAIAARFMQDSYVIRRKVFKLFGQAFHVYDAAGNVVLYSKLKAFKLKEDIRLYTDETMSTEVLSIQARSIIDFSAAYDVIDPQRRERVGALRRKGFSSLIRDEWVILDASEREVGKVIEDSTAMALVRRFIDAASLIFPQKFHVDVMGRPAAFFKQNFNPFVRKLELDFTPDQQHLLDRRMGLAAAILVAAIEGRQS